MNARERELLLEAAVTAHRERDREGRLVPPPAWWDLPPEARDELLELQIVTRRLERAVSPTGASGTVLSVLKRIMGV